MPLFDIHIVPTLSDNYAYLLHDSKTGTTAAVDVSEAGPVYDAAKSKGWEISYILSTHHHWDHTDGNNDLKEKTGCKVEGAKKDAHRVPGIDIELSEGDEFAIGNTVAKIMEIPGHTSGHIAYWFEKQEAIFVGDTLFSLGVGRLFEGTPAQMWESLKRIRSLPDETKVYCGHEYTMNCLSFAAYVQPDNKDLQRYADLIKAKAIMKKPTMPTSVLIERLCNPFMRVDVPELQEALGQKGREPAEIFETMVS